MNFSSDNTTPVAPEILDAIARANDGHAMPYGNDALTKRVEDRISTLFERQCHVFLVPTGTAANALALSALCPPYGAIYCHEMGHINVDECGAPEFFTGGAKLVGLSADKAKLCPTDVAERLARPDVYPHHVVPAALSLSQATETGCVYSPTEVAALAEIAKAKGLKMHMDGARFANAVVSLGCSPAEVTWKAGIDILCFGATKNGALMAEAIVVFDETLAANLAHRRKRGGHLASKMRFIAAQFDAYLDKDLWQTNARHANAAATKLAEGLERLGLNLAWPCQANEVFVTMPVAMADTLQDKGFVFYRWATTGDAVQVRLVTAFNTALSDVDTFIKTAQTHL